MYHINKLNDSRVNPVYAVSMEKGGVVKFAIIDKNNHKEIEQKWGHPLPNLFDLDPSSLAYELPGIKEEVINPVTGNKVDLYHCIMNLNDVQGWSREKIAMWIRSLPDQDRFKF